jgi:hypothetical protein
VLLLADSWNTPNVMRPDRAAALNNEFSLVVLAAEVRRLQAYETPEEMEPILRVTRENAQLRTDLAARDALIGKLRENLTCALNSFRITQNPVTYGEAHRSQRSIAAAPCDAIDAAMEGGK